MSILKQPTDIQLTKDTIFVLSDQNPFLYTFNYNLTQLHNTVCDSICKHLKCPCSFVIDGNASFIISDYNNNIVMLTQDTQWAFRGVSGNRKTMLDSHIQCIICI